jgi:glucose-6-phosphate 1-dehydrogenase
MSTTHTDVLVLFGATGDLAFKKIFPALQSLAHLGPLDIPVVAVTRGGLGKEALLSRSRESLEAYGGRGWTKPPWGRFRAGCRLSRANTEIRPPT